MDDSQNTALRKLPEPPLSKKRPRFMRDLAATGLLEGLPVKYIPLNCKMPGLKGVIRGAKVVCFCAICNGSKAVSFNTFELHAGRKRRRALHSIYLENGNTLHGVLEACKAAPVDILESTIRSAVGLLPKNPKNCIKCNEASPISDPGKSLCDSCLELNQPNNTPTPSHASASNASKRDDDNNSQLPDVAWLSSLSEPELDFLISLKELATMRARNIGCSDLAENFDLRTLRALGIILLEVFKEQAKSTSVDPTLVKLLDKSALLTEDNSTSMACDDGISRSFIVPRRKQMWEG